MVDLQFNGQFFVGNDDLDFGISDLALVFDQDDEMILVSVTRGGGGAVAWNLSDTSSPELVSTRTADTEFASSTGSMIVALDQPDGAGLMITGLGAGGVDLSETNGHGGIRPVNTTNIDDTNWTTGHQMDNGLVALADADGSGFSMFTHTDDTFTAHSTVSDTGATHASAITAMASFGNVLLVGSAGEFGISSYTTTSTTTTAASSFGPDSGLGIMIPTAINTVEIDGQGFAVVASAGGSSGALTVFSVGIDGSLIPTDHALDSLETRFGAVQDVAVAAWGDGALVVAGGGDDGLSVMALMPNGRLVHLDAFEDTNTLALSGVTSITLTITGDEATIFTATQGDAGFSMMTIDLGDFGDWAIADGGLFTGTENNDILMTDSTATILDGGAGNDIFVISETGDADHRVRNFNPAEDTLNLSDWSFLYDVDSLSFRTMWNGVEITHRGETLTVTGIGNGPLTIEDVRASIDLDLTRLPTIPNDTIMGTSGDDALSGNWAADTIYGENGNDTLTGGAGDDVIFGGDGVDHAVLNAGTEFTVLAFDDTTRTVTLETADGIDTFADVETFEIGGTEYAFSDFAPPPRLFMGTDAADNLNGNDTGVSLFGFGGDDDIIGGAGGDILDGGDGDDTLVAGGGDDTMFGGAGNDTVFGGDGTDTYVSTLDTDNVFVLDWAADSVTIQSTQGTDTIADVEFFDFAGTTVSHTDLAPDGTRIIVDGTSDDDDITVGSGSHEINTFGGDDDVNTGSGDDIIVTGNGNDRIWSGEGRDEVLGGSGGDRIWGDDGNDMLDGGSGGDILYGQAGNDLLLGGTGNDKLIGGNGDDMAFGGDGKDFLTTGKLADQLWGGDGDDDVRGGDDNDELWGDGGNDIMRGGFGDDFIFGGVGDDVILGGNGTDIIFGGAGDDTLEGGGNPDTFVFEANHGTDQITDYNIIRDSIVFDVELVGNATSGQDVIDLFGSETETGVRFTFDDGSILNIDDITLSDTLAGTITIE